MKKIFVSILLGMVLAFGPLFSITAQAASATLYLAPSSGTFVIGSRFSTTVKVNTGGAAINAAQGSISFDKDVLKVVSVSTGGSIFSLWTTQPGFNNGAGTITFAGGVPHPGYTGSAGTICTITFESLKVGTGGVRFTSGFVLANDGKGTNILSTMGSGSYSISPKSEAPKATPAKPTSPASKTEGQPIPKKEEVVERATYNEPKVTSETHADENKWFSGDKVKFSWELPDGVEGVSLAFDNEADTDPGPKSDGLFNSKEYPIAKDGHWYFHIKFQDDKDRWGTITHFRINSDNTPPDALKVETIQEENEWPILKFETGDELSGIDRYEIVIDDLQAEPKVLLADNPVLKVENLETGEHTAFVRVFDRANNETSATVKININTIATPEIKNYTAELSPGNEFFISGTAVSRATVIVYIQKDNSEPEKFEIKADENGNWFLVPGKDFDKGQYTAYAKAINDKGMESKESPRISFLVSPPVFAKIGSFVVNYFTVLVSLLFMIILIVLLLLFLVELIRKKLKKETLEIEEVLERNLTNAKKLMEMDLNSVRMNKAERDVLKAGINKKIDEAKAGILKEVKDVEKILK